MYNTIRNNPYVQSYASVLCYVFLFFFVFFFFQAEDGIRDVAVTGVQTCALPICNNPWLACHQGQIRHWKVHLLQRCRQTHPKAAVERPRADSAGYSRYGSRSTMGSGSPRTRCSSGSESQWLCHRRLDWRRRLVFPKRLPANCTVATLDNRSDDRSSGQTPGFPEP